ncbi:FRG1-like family-domain-containing protein [Schizophyllum commune]
MPHRHAQKVRSTKLKFKGEKGKKKRKRDEDDEGRPGGSRRRGGDDLEPEAWVRPDAPNEIRGPTFIFHPSEASPICITYNATTNRLALAPLAKDDPEEPPSVMERTPTDVSQVWVTTRVAGSPTINLRTGTGEGKFLSCDAHGIVAADRDARGPQEEWTPVIMSDGMVAFQNVYEKYLSIDETAGGGIQLRGDSEEVGFNERFWVKIQNKYKQEAHAEERKKKDAAGPPEMDEHEINKLYQSFGGRNALSAEHKKELKKAKKEGRLAEALLDLRSKLRSDRFC